MSMPILATKLTLPPLRSRLMPRAHLMRKLDQGLECGLVLISAPAGYGKSTLLNAWLRNSARPVVWYALDEGDNDPARFLTYLAAAWCQVAPDSGEAFELSLPNGSLSAVEVLLTHWVNQLSQFERPFWLVVDDYHIIHNQTVHQIVSFLLEHRPAPLHLAIATRADPPLPLSRLRARAQLVELRLADLRFSTSEIAEFLSGSMRLNLSEPDLAILAASTEGWVAGLQMAGLSLQGRADASEFIRTFSAENRYILDFLFDEVFQHQPAAIQDFLLQTSILERLCGALCDQVTQRQDSQAMLEALEHSNLFLIALDEQRHWYRYHHLFRSLLQNRRQRTSPAASAGLHQRASAWFATQQDLENAIVHALAASDFDSTASLLEQAAPNLDPQNQQALLATWLDQLPRAVLEAHPRLCMHRAWGYYWTGRRAAEEEWLQAAEKGLERSPALNAPEQLRLRGQIAAVRAHTALAAEDIPRTLEMGQAALELLTADDEMRCETAIALGAAYWARGEVRRAEQTFAVGLEAATRISRPSTATPAACYAGLQQVKQGHLAQALTTFRTGLRLATLSNGQETPVAGFPNLRISDLWREWNDLAQAGQHLLRGLAQCRQLGQPDVLADAYACLGHYQLALGDLAAAAETLAQADHLIQHAKVDHWVLCWLDDCRLKTWLAQGDLPAAARWALSSGLTADGPLSYQHDLHHQNLARVLVTQGVWEGSRPAQTQARTLLARLEQAAAEAGWVQQLISFHVLQAINAQAQGLDELGGQHLAKAVALAEPGRFIRIFLDEGAPLRALLGMLAEALRTAQPGAQAVEGLELAHINRLLAAFPPGAAPDEASPHPSTQALVEPLSARELEVLALLAQGRADKEIAANLVIARETVHKHLKNIYGKLDVHNRTAAVARARTLGLL
jgi:LuxR family maltose regulon positive regulatory protein